DAAVPAGYYHLHLVESLVLDGGQNGTAGGACRLAVVTEAILLAEAPGPTVMGSVRGAQLPQQALDLSGPAERHRLRKKAAFADFFLIAAGSLEQKCHEKIRLPSMARPAAGRKNVHDICAAGGRANFICPPRWSRGAGSRTGVAMQQDQLNQLLSRAEQLLNRVEELLPPAPPAPDWNAHAFRWRKQGGRGFLEAIP